MTEQGIVTSLMCIAAGPDGALMMRISGEFAEDVEYAIDAAREGFSGLLDIRLEPSAPAHHEIPHMLRKRRRN